MQISSRQSNPVRRVRWWQVARPVAAGLLGLAICLSLTLPAAAHAELESTTPAANEVLPDQPDQIVLTFNEPVSPVERQFRLFDANQTITHLEPKASGNSVLVPLPEGLARGSYVLAWRVISADGHPIAGALPFAIGETSSTGITVTEAQANPWIERLLGLLQGITYICFLSVVGLLAFRHLLERAPVLQTDAIFTVTLTGLVAMALAIPLTVVRQQAETAAYLFDASDWIARIRSDAWLAFGIACIGATVLLIGTGLATRNARTWVMAFGALMTLGSLSIVGHTRIVDPAVLIVTSNVAHVVAGAVWLGGLIGLTLAFRRWESEAAGLADLVARFSGVATLTLAGVLISGTISSALILRSIDALIDTSYGQLLMVKVALVLVVCGLGAWNRFRLVPAIARHTDERAGLSTLQRIVHTEASILVVVALLTGFLVNLSPRVAATDGGHDHETHPEIQFLVPLGDQSARGSLSHLDDRRYNLQVIVVDETGIIVTPYETPTMTLTLESLDIGPLPVTLRSNPDGTKFTAIVDFPFAGDWTLSMAVRFSTFDSSSGQTIVTIPDGT